MLNEEVCDRLSPCISIWTILCKHSKSSINFGNINTSPLSHILSVMFIKVHPNLLKGSLNIKNVLLTSARPEPDTTISVLLYYPQSTKSIISGSKPSLFQPHNYRIRFFIVLLLWIKLIPHTSKEWYFQGPHLFCFPCHVLLSAKLSTFHSLLGHLLKMWNHQFQCKTKVGGAHCNLNGHNSSGAQQCQEEILVKEEVRWKSNAPLLTHNLIYLFVFKIFFKPSEKKIKMITAHVDDAPGYFNLPRYAWVCEAIVLILVVQ